MDDGDRWVEVVTPDLLTLLTEHPTPALSWGDLMTNEWRAALAGLCAGVVLGLSIFMFTYRLNLIEVHWAIRGLIGLAVIGWLFAAARGKES